VLLVAVVVERLQRAPQVVLVVAAAAIQAVVLQAAQEILVDIHQ
jgi:hypothetical protein